MTVAQCDIAAQYLIVAAVVAVVLVVLGAGWAKVVVELCVYGALVLLVKADRKYYRRLRRHNE